MVAFAAAADSNAHRLKAMAPDIVMPEPNGSLTNVMLVPAATFVN
jgi:hypothetical protein